MVLATSAKTKKEEDYTLEDCDKLANRLTAMKDLPVVCQKFPTVVKKVQNKEKAAGDAFAGIGANAQRRVTSAKIQRRMTTTKTFNKNG